MPGAPWRLVAPGIDQLGRAARAGLHDLRPTGTGDVTDLAARDRTPAPPPQLAQTLQHRRRRRHHPARAPCWRPMGVRYVVVPAGRRAQAVQHRADQPADRAAVDAQRPARPGRRRRHRGRGRVPQRRLGTDPGPAAGRAPRSRRAVPAWPRARGARPGRRARPPCPRPGAYQSFAGPLSKAQTVYLSEAASSHWELAGRRPHRAPGDRRLGWASTFASRRRRRARIGHAAATTRPSRAGLWLAGQALLWLLVLGCLFRDRVRAQSVRDLGPSWRPRGSWHEPAGAAVGRPAVAGCLVLVVAGGRGRRSCSTDATSRPPDPAPVLARPSAANRGGRPGHAQLHLVLRGGHGHRHGVRGWPSRPSSSQNASGRTLDGRIAGMTDSGKTALARRSGSRPTTTSTCGCPT